MTKASFLKAAKTGVNRKKMQNTVSNYRSMFNDDADAKLRESKSLNMVNSFYDLVADFYEYGW